MKVKTKNVNVALSKDVYEHLKYASEITHLTMSTIMRMGIWKEVSEIVEDYNHDKYE